MTPERGPTMAPLINDNMGRGGGGGGGDQRQEQQERWRTHFDNSSVNAVSFGFVATAILISMFLVMAIFERFLRPPNNTNTTSPLTRTRRRRRRQFSSSSAAMPDLEAHHRGNFARKLDDFPSSPKLSIYAKGYSVLMPGNNIPTFIARPAPAPCPPEKILWPPHDHVPIKTGTSTSD